MFENIIFMEEIFFLTSKFHICQILQFFLTVIFRFTVKTLKKIYFCLFESVKSIKILSLQFKENHMLNHIVSKISKKIIFFSNFCLKKSSRVGRSIQSENLIFLQRTKILENIIFKLNFVFFYNLLQKTK